MKKNLYLSGLEQDMYLQYKTSMFAKGRTPLKFEDWKMRI